MPKHNKKNKTNATSVQTSKRRRPRTQIKPRAPIPVFIELLEASVAEKTGGELRSWHCCESCGDLIFPNAQKKWLGITVMTDECPYCKRVTTLIPYSDWRGFFD